MKRTSFWASALIAAVGLTACVTPSGRMDSLRTGITAEVRGEFDAAIETYTAQLASSGLSDQEREVFLLRRAHAYISKGEFAKGIEDADAAIGLRPGSEAGYNTRALAYMRQQQYEMAIADYDMSLRLRALPLTYYHRGGAYAMNNQSNQALADYSEAIRLAPRLSQAYASRGSLYTQQGDYKLALTDFDNAVGLAPDSAGTYNSRGDLYGRQGEYDKAYRDFSTALLFQPESAVLYSNRGHMAAALGRFTVAADDLARSVTLVPNGHDVIWLHLFRTKAGTSDTAEFSRNAAAVTQQPWPQAIISVYLGQMAPDQLRKMAEQASADAYDIVMCQAVFHSGYAQLLRGDLASARPALQEAAKSCPDLSSEKRLAVNEIKIMS